MVANWYKKFISGAPKPDLQGTLNKAELGDADAQFGLGLKYGNSLGDSLDFEQAAQWYRKAAAQNHALAQFNLGVMYAKGQGVPLDDAESARWLKKAADLGDAGAQFSLGMRCHRDSVGGNQNAMESRIEAYKWYHLAAEQGYRGSIAARETLTFTMTHAEVAEACHRAALWTDNLSSALPPSGS